MSLFMMQKTSKFWLIYKHEIINRWRGCNTGRRLKENQGWRGQKRKHWIWKKYMGAFPDVMQPRSNTVCSCTCLSETNKIIIPGVFSLNFSLLDAMLSVNVKTKKLSWTAQGCKQAPLSYHHGNAVHLLHKLFKHDNKCVFIT